LKNLGEDYKEWYLELEIDKMAKFTSYAKDFNLDRDIIEKAQNFQNEFKELLEEDLSLDKFKEKYLDFKQRHDEFVKEYEIAMGDKMMIKDTEISQTQNKQEKENFKPIQGKSKNKETYKDNNIKNELLKKLLENSFDTRKQLELLFGTKFDDDKSYNEFNQLFSQIKLNNNVDLRV
ncbi:MAG: hypothetical protein J1D99_04705, partial [Campylobacter sp.]|nr:hypothetical protein [Campylobacter sp.]